MNDLLHPISLLIPPDKSLSHRVLILAALADGPSHLNHVLLSEDVLNTLTVLSHLGIKMKPDCDFLLNEFHQKTKTSFSITVWGQGINGLKPAASVLYCGNSGTTLRLMLGVLSQMPFKSQLTGDESLNERPINRVTEPLKLFGSQFEVHTVSKNRIVTCFKPNQTKHEPVVHQSKLASAQVKSALLLAGLCAQVPLQYQEPILSRNHTENLLCSLNLHLKISLDGKKLDLNPTGDWAGFDYTVPSDFSSALYFIVAALLMPKTSFALTNINLNPTRILALDVLKSMGAKIRVEEKGVSRFESYGDILVQSSDLNGGIIPSDKIPFLIDEIPILALAGAFGEGVFEVRGALELRVKESDRIKNIIHHLTPFVEDLKEYEDGFSFKGIGAKGMRHKPLPSNWVFDSLGDHRLAMMAAVFNKVMGWDYPILKSECVNTSFPGFFELLNSIHFSKFS